MLYCCNVSFYAIPWQRERKQVGFPPRPSTRCARAVFQPLAHGLTQEPGEGRINKGRGLVTRTKTEGNLNLDGGEQTSQKGGEETREKREEREREREESTHPGYTRASYSISILCFNAARPHAKRRKRKERRNLLASCGASGETLTAQS